MQKKYHLMAVLVALVSSRAMAATEEELEKGLIEAMRLNKETRERMAESGKPIQAYMREGFVGRRPNRRYDYTDYYLLKKPARFLGHQLVMIEEEYMLGFIGCCVNPGVGVTLKVEGSATSLEDFAEQNGCRMEEQVDFQKQIGELGIKAKPATGNYVSLSCRERDLALTTSETN